MELVAELDDIKRNMRSIDEYLNNEELKEFAIGLIKRGTCFIAVKKERGYSFYPSRYIGYKDNNFNAHINNHNKDGRDTNPAISRIIGQEPIPSEELEDEYQKYCSKLGFTPNKKGAFGVTRKYWLL